MHNGFLDNNSHESAREYSWYASPRILYPLICYQKTDTERSVYEARQDETSKPITLLRSRRLDENVEVALELTLQI